MVDFLSVLDFELSENSSLLFLSDSADELKKMPRETGSSSHQVSIERKWMKMMMHYNWITLMININ